MAAKKKKRTKKKASRKKAARKTGRSRSRKARRRSVKMPGWTLRVALIAVVIGLGYLVYLDFTVRVQMEGKRWSVPASVYTQPMELYAGKALTVEQLRAELKALGYQSDESLSQSGSYFERGDAIHIYSRGFRFWDEAAGEQVLDVRVRGGRVRSLVGKEGEPVAIARLEPRQIGNVLPTEHEDRRLIDLDQAPPHLVGGLLAVEDQHFTDHYGIDFSGLARAAWANIRAGSVVQGGSTITQQLVKNFYLTSERTLSRKLKEMVMAFLLELHYDKQEILETYLNEVYLGQSGQRAIHGFGLASEFYFGRPLSELELSQTALLVALVRGASYYNPRLHPERALARRNLVIDRMVDVGFLEPEEATQAKGLALGVVSQAVASGTAYPAFFQLVRRQLRENYAEEDLRSEGLRLFTTLDPLIQSVVEEKVSARLEELEGRRGITKGALNAAVVVARVESGEVAALVGDRRARYVGFNRALDAQRPVGSVIKPVVYLSALEDTANWTLASVIRDAPVTISQRGAPDWSPQNYDREFHGDTLLLDALARSFNVSTARVGMDIGIDRIIDMIHRLGVTREFKAYPSLVLGAAGMTPLEVAQIYLTIANNGFRTALRSARAVLSARGEPLARYPIEVKQVVEPDTVALLHYALQEVVRTGTARALGDRFSADMALAGKTGTTDGFRDSWFAGYSGNYVTVVWLGRDDNEPTGLTGASGAMLLWRDVMAALDLTPTFPVVREGIRFVRVDAEGRRAVGCPEGRDIPFIAGTIPRKRASCDQSIVMER